jgi:orotidine-5'-phosphate decarboxylase
LNTYTPASDQAAQVIVALDFPSAKPALELVDRMGKLVQWYKVGLELYLAAGNTLVRELKDRGLSVFLDLKLHDIPNTVAGAIRSVAAAGADMLTVHAFGGPAMLTAAAETAAGIHAAPKLLAVSVLTSLDSAQLQAIGVVDTPAVEVLRLAALASSCGIPGLVASSEEIAALRANFPHLTLVIPGIRPSGSPVGDQKRIATPAAAVKAGADYLVVGRPITQASDPVAAATDILDEIAGVTTMDR